MVERRRVSFWEGFPIVNDKTGWDVVVVWMGSSKNVGSLKSEGNEKESEKVMKRMKVIDMGC